MTDTEISLCSVVIFMQILYTVCTKCVQIKESFMYLLKMFIQQISSTHTPQNTLNLILDTKPIYVIFMCFFFFI